MAFKQNTISHTDSQKEKEVIYKYCDNSLKSMCNDVSS